MKQKQGKMWGGISEIPALGGYLHFYFCVQGISRFLFCLGLLHWHTLKILVLKR